MRTLNDKGRALLIEREGLYLKPYLDSAKVPTIGIGTIAYEDGRKVKMSDMPITEARAYSLLEFELKDKAETIEKFCTKKGLILNENQFSALLSFAYNLGCGPIIDSGRSMHQALISQHPTRIREAFMMYDKARAGLFGRLISVRGLTIRRKMEADLYFS